MELAPQQISIKSRKIRSLVHNSIKTAEAINLVYVSDKDSGISRVKNKEGFTYTIEDKEVNDDGLLHRIKSLVLPPAWQDVWICLPHNGHLQATGLDTNGRKQYRYHPLWNALRSQTKFFHLYDFGNALCGIRKQLDKDLALPGLPLPKVLAAIVSVMEYTGVRIGNNIYEKLYGSFGLTTLKDKHVKIAGSEMRFSFKGKKGVYQDITLKSRRLAKIIKQCRDIPGKELFQYYDDAGARRSVDSGMVNEYIKNICGKDFSAKDFRTWAGTLYALEAFRAFGCCDTVADTKKKIIEAIDIAAGRLGNTRTVCKKYYVHPVVITHYTDKTIDKYIQKVSKATGNTGLTPEEQILMYMLEDIGEATIVV
jgi:DNA topoisomerase-1